MNKELLYKLGEEFIEFAKVVGQITDDIVFTPYGRLKIHNVSREYYYNNLRKFEKAGLIKKNRKKYSGYELTEKAKLLRKEPSQKIKRTDGQSTIIMFDIPESKHKTRDIFRRYLVRNGYTQIQKSVFIGPYKIFNDLVELVKELGIVSNVTFITGRIDRI